MKYLLVLFLCFSTVLLKGQDVKALDKVLNTENVRDNKSIICGSFIQRLGFSSGGFPQDIIIQNNDTKEFFKFRVKPTYTSKKENQFCVHINPGSYIIVNYLWTQSKWYGGTMYGEPIIKNLDVSHYIEENKVISKELYEDISLRYKFNVEKGKIVYLGTWHFDTGLVSFTDDKENLMAIIGAKYKKINLKESVTMIPE